MGTASFRGLWETARAHRSARESVLRGAKSTVRSKMPRVSSLFRFNAFHPAVLMRGFPLAGVENQRIAHISGALDLSN